MLIACLFDLLIIKIRFNRGIYVLFLSFCNQMISIYELFLCFSSNRSSALTALFFYKSSVQCFSFLNLKSWNLKFVNNILYFLQLFQHLWSFSRYCYWTSKKKGNGGRNGCFKAENFNRYFDERCWNLRMSRKFFWNQLRGNPLTLSTLFMYLIHLFEWPNSTFEWKWKNENWCKKY